MGEGAGIVEGVVAVEISVVVMGRGGVVLVAMVMDDDLSQNMEMFAGEMKSSLLPPIKTAFWKWYT